MEFVIKLARLNNVEAHEAINFGDALEFLCEGVFSTGFEFVFCGILGERRRKVDRCDVGGFSGFFFGFDGGEKSVFLGV